MARYFALIGNENVVVTVLVANSEADAIAAGGAGWWVETFRGHPTERYAGKGRVYAQGDPRKFLAPHEVS